LPHWSIWLIAFFVLLVVEKGNNKVFIPFESKGLLGSIGAIKELLKDDGPKA